MSDLTGGGVREDRVVSAIGALVRGGGSWRLGMSVSVDDVLTLPASGVSGAKNVSGTEGGVGVRGVGRSTVGGSSVESESHKFGGEWGLGDWVDDLGGVVFSAV